MKKGISKLLFFVVCMVIMVQMVLPVSVFALSSPTNTGLFAGKYGMAQIFDVQRRPPYPTAGSPFNLSRFKNIYNSVERVQISWGTDEDRYVQFKDEATQGSSGYTVSLNLYEANGTLVKTISNYGTVWGLGSEGFFYEGHDHYGYFISNQKGFAYGSELVYIPETGLIHEIGPLLSYQASTEVLDPGETAGGSDTTSPTVEITTSESSPTNSDSIAVKVTFSEDVTGFDVTDIKTTNGGPDNFSGSGDVYTFNIVQLTEGTVTVNIDAGVAEDAAGNKNTVASQLSIVSDITNPTDPTITVKDDSGKDYVSDSWYGGDSVGFELTGSTDTSGVTYQYKINDDSDWTDGDSKTISREGSYTIRYRTIDGAGQPSNEQSVIVKIDRTKPSKPDIDMTSNGASYANGDWTNGNVSIDLNGSTDNFTSDDDIVYFYSGNGIDYVRGSVFELSTEGTFEIYAKAKDESGNYSDVRTATINIDRTNPTDPTITVKDDSGKDYVSDSWYGGDSVGFELTGSTDTSGVTYQYKINDDSDWTDGDSKTISREGSYTIRYRTIDGAGQPSNEQSATVKIDRTKPTIVLKGDNPFYVDVDASYDEPGVLVSDDLGTIKGNVIVSGTVESTRKGDYTIVYHIFDEAGNHGEVERTVTVVKPLTVTLDQATKYVTRVDAKGTIENLGATNDLLRYGFVYGRTEGVDIEDTVVQLSGLTDVGEFTELITKLNPGAKYYIKAFAEDSTAIRYSDEKVFRTKEKKMASLETDEESEEPTEPTEAEHWAKGKTDKMDENFKIKEVFDDGDDDNDGDDDMDYERGITRGEIAGVLCRVLDILGNDISDEKTFDDLEENHKLYRDMMVAVEYGIFKGYGDETIKPDQVISREEMAAVIHRTMSKVVELAEASDKLEYKDKEKIKLWAQEQVEILTELEIFEGYEDGEFKPENTIKVGEAITALYRMADYMEYIK